MKNVRKTKIKSAIRKTERLFEQLDLTVEEVVIVSSTIHEIAKKLCGKDWVFPKSDEE
jgi:peptidase E